MNWVLLLWVMSGCNWIEFEKQEFPTEQICIEAGQEEKAYRWKSDKNIIEFVCMPSELPQ